MKTLTIGDLKISVPIIQGGMGVGISLSGLASAVANEGGVGVISAAGLGLLYKNAAKGFEEACNVGMREEIRKARAKTKGIIGVNIMVALTNFAEMMRICIEEKVDIIFAGAGLPTDMPSYLTEGSTTKLVPIVSSARGTKVICDKWLNNYNYLPDAVVVEGPKAGGHLGYKVNQIDDEAFALEQTVPEILAALKPYEEKSGKAIPLIAGGGIYTGEDIYNIMNLGAAGVQMGTIFVTTDECDADITFKNTYIDATKEDIELINSPVGMPGRAIYSPFIQKIRDGEKVPKVCPFHCLKPCAGLEAPYCIVVALYNSYNGNMEKGYAFAGTNAYRATEIISVKQTIDRLKSEYDEKVKSLA
jgi:nitronate monooxygenase